MGSHYSVLLGESIESLNVKEDGIWKLTQEIYTLEASLARETTSAGTLRRQEVRAVAGEEALVTLPCSRYEEGLQ